mgnify:CR=1 FL=1
MREPVTWDRVADPAGIAEVVHPGWVQRALTAEDWRGFPGNEPGGGEGVSKVERIAQQIFDKLAGLHITYVHEPAESVPGAQRVRAVDEVLSLGQATCLDMCVTFCSAALDAGIYPLLLTVHQEEYQRHALVLVPVDRRWSFGVPALLDEGFSRSPLVLDGDDVRDLVANVPDDAMGAWLAIDVEQAIYSADRDAGDWACAIASGASYVKEWDWDVCVDVGGIRAQQDNSSELPTLVRTEKVLAPGYLPLPDDSTPLQMIQTRYGVVPFCSRPEYRELKEWAVGNARSSGRKSDVSVAVLTGAGGVGKTRMAAQLCHDLEVLGWCTGFAPAKSTMGNDDLTYLAELTTELLIVVDYAEESRQEQLAALLRALRGRRSPTRIILTARGIDSWWEDFREELESDGIQLGRGLVKELEPRPDPVLLYRRALQGFSRVMNQVNPQEVETPENVGGTALDIVLRAWLAVVDDSGMQAPQPERSVERDARSARASNLNARDSLYDRVLRLEFNRWRVFPELQDISLIHLRRIAATLSLLAPDASQVDGVLSRLLEWRNEHLRRSRLAELLNTILLGSDSGGGVSLRPDPVAEHLVLSVFGDDPDQVDEVLPGDPLDVPGISEPDASEGVVARALMLGQQAQNLSQMITRAASQDRESASKLARHVLKTCPHLWGSALEVALAQGGPFVGALEYLVDSGVDLPFEEIERSIPLEHSTLRGVALAAVQRMEGRSESDPAERARYLRRLANRLSKSGRRDEALEAAQEAIILYRKLVELYPEIYTSDLAMTLDNLGNRLSEVGRRDEGLEAVREAVEQYRLLAAASPETYASNLASSLNNLAYLLSGVGYRDEAAEIGKEAVTMYRSLVAKSSSHYLPEMAASLDNLAIFLSGVGRQREALEVVREATEIYRRLEEASPATYASDLMVSLNNLALRLSGAGCRREALEATQEAVGLCRGLAKELPDAYSHLLAALTDNLAVRLSEMGRLREALDVAREAVEMYRDLVKTSKVSATTYSPDLALSLNNLAYFLSVAGNHDEAAEIGREAECMYRDLVKESSREYVPKLAGVLANLATSLSMVRRLEEALDAAREGTQLRRDLAKESPAVYVPDLATSLGSLAPLLWGVGRQDEALEVAQEAVGLRRELAQAAPEAYGPDLVTSLSNLVGILTELQYRDEALGAAQEALELYWDLMEVSPGVYSSDLAGALNNLSKFLSGVGRRGEALEVAREAVRLYRELVEVSPGVYSSDLAGALNNLSSRLSEMESRDNAMGATREIGGIWRGLAEVSPEAYTHGLARLSNTLVVLPSEVGCLGEAVEAAHEAVGLYRELAKVSQEAHAPGLAMSLSNLSNRLSEAGSWDNAVEAAREAVGLYRELAEVSPGAYTHDLARLSNTLVVLLSEVGCLGEALEAAHEAVGLYRELVKVSPSDYTPNLVTSLNNLASLLSKAEIREVILSVFTEDFDRFSPALRSRLLLARATWRDDDQEEDLKEAAREADQPDDPMFLGPTRRMVVQALADAGCDDADLPAWATATTDESVRSRITDWQHCRGLKEQAAHLKNGWASPSKSDCDALAVEAERYVDIPAIKRLLSVVDLVMVEGVDSVAASLNSVDHAQNLAASWYSAHTNGRGASFLCTQLREQDEDSASGTDQSGDADEDSRTLGDPEIRALVLEVLEANLPEGVFNELRRTLEFAELSDADIAYAVLASDEDAEDALKELLETARWRAMLMVPGLRPGLEEKSVHGGVAVALHAAVSEQPDQAHDLLRSAYEKADPGDRILIEVLMAKASRADDCPQEIADLCAWFRKERSLREETGNGSPSSPS